MLANHIPAADRELRTPRERWSLFLVILFVLAYKCNDALSYPQFWAEDATVFFKEQVGSAWPQLLSPYAGYLHAIPRLIAWVASWMPPGKAPLIYNAAAIVLSAAAIYFTAQRLRRFLPIWIVALSFLAAPTSGEIFGTITNAQWFLQFVMAAYCLAPTEQGSTRTATWLKVLAILVISLTGPFSFLLLIVIIACSCASLISRRSGIDPFNGHLSGFLANRDWPAIAAMSVGAIVQSAVLVTHPPTQHEVEQPILAAFKITFTEIVPIHVFGTDFLTGTGWLLIYALVISALLWTRKVDGRARLLALGFLALAAIECFAPMLRASDLDPLRPLAAADRYFYLFKVVWWWVIWLVLCDGTRRSRLNATAITTALICFFAITNAGYMQRNAFVDFAWRGHTATLDLPGTHTIPVNPPGWSITVETPETGEAK